MKRKCIIYCECSLVAHNLSKAAIKFLDEISVIVVDQTPDVYLDFDFDWTISPE